MTGLPEIGGKETHPKLDCRICCGSTYCCIHAAIDPSKYASISAQDHAFKRVVCVCGEGNECENRDSIQSDYEMITP